MKPIQITDSLIAIQVPKDVSDFWINNCGCIRYSKNEGKVSSVLEPEYLGFYAEKEKHQIIGLVQTPELTFDFDVLDEWVSLMSITRLNIFGYQDYTKDEIIDGIKHNDYTLKTKADSFRSRIEKAIQDSGFDIKENNLLIIEKI